MSLGRYDPRAAANRGAICTLVDPATGKELREDGRPIEFRVLGRDSDAVQDRLMELMKMQRDGDKGVDSAFIGRELVRVAIAGWSDNVGISEVGDLPYTPENAGRLLEDPNTSWIAEQLGPFSMARRNYLPNRQTASSSEEQRKKGS